VQVEPVGPPEQLVSPATLGDAFKPGPVRTHMLNVVVCPAVRGTVEGNDGSSTTPKSLLAMVIPVPVNAMACGLPVALSVLMNCPVRTPTADGLKASPPVTLDPAEIVTGLTILVAESKLYSVELKLKLAVMEALPVLLICSG